MKRNTIIKFTLSVIAPFICNILIAKEFDLSLLILLPIFLISFITLISSSNKLTKIYNGRKYYKIIGYSFVLMFFISYNFQITVSQYISFQWHKTELKEIVEALNESNISIMTDGYENLNGYPITNLFGLGKTYPLDSILNLYNIDKEQYEELRSLLISIRYISVSKSEDEIVFIMKGGIIDNCHGIAYSFSENQPSENLYGEIIKWEKISGNWYAWWTT